MKIEVGKSYRARNGEVYIITKKTDHVRYPFKNNDGMAWTPEGKWFHTQHSIYESQYDLIAPVRVESIADRFARANGDFDVVTEQPKPLDTTDIPRMWGDPPRREFTIQGTRSPHWGLVTPEPEAEPPFNEIHVTFEEPTLGWGYDFDQGPEVTFNLSHNPQIVLESKEEIAKRVYTQKELEAYRLQLPTSRKARKAAPMAEGFLDYFPDACYDVARLSTVGNVQHNGDEPLHWARDKGGNNRDEIIRHTLQSRTLDTDGVMHATKVAWRALAEAQLAIEQYRANGGVYPPEEE